ncbi:hypothetical protein HG531_010564 [Fusarium graminearum]|nr:hypothetical protein HG531_010564 [Fusarium graminearum]
MSGHGGLLESLSECGVGVTGSGNVLAGSTVLEGQSTLSNHLTSVRADDVDSKNAIGLGISKHLNHTLGVDVGLGSRVGGKREASDSVRDVLALEVLLTLANPGNLGLRGLCTYRLDLATLGRVNLKLNLVARLVTTNDLGVELELKTLLLKDLLGVLGDLRVHARTTNLAEELNDSDFRSKSRPDGSHLKTDNTTTNDGHGLRDLLKGNSTGAGNDALLVDLKAGERSSLGSSSDQNVLTTNAGLTALVEVNLDLVLVDERASTLDVLNSVLLEEVLDTLGKTRDGGFLGLHEVGQVELDIADLDTAVFGVVENLVVEMRVVEKRL